MYEACRFCYTFLTSVLDGGEWLAAGPGYICQGEKTWFLLDKKLDIAVKKKSCPTEN
jgi:hypothetical protein